MTIQQASTNELDECQRTVIARTRYTAEHNAPAINLIEKMTLGKGEKAITVPKAAQMEAFDLTDGVDIGDEQDIGISVTDLTTGEIGLKVVLTDKLVRQLNEDAFNIVGKQTGDAIARKKDKDALALYTALNGGTDLGATTRALEFSNLLVCLTFARAKPFSNPISCVLHPNTMGEMRRSQGLGAYGADVSAAIPSGFTADLLKDYWTGVNIDGIPFFHDGNITIDSNNDGQGAIFSKSAMVYVESVGQQVRRQEDISLRATEFVVTSDFGVFELDDAQGAGMLFVASAPATA